MLPRRVPFLASAEAYSWELPIASNRDLRVLQAGLREDEAPRRHIPDGGPAPAGSMRRRRAVIRIDYTCPKCEGTEFETRELRGAGGFWSKIFDVQGRKFTTVTCTRCRHTELYAVPSGKLENVFDLFTQ